MADQDQDQEPEKGGKSKKLILIIASLIILVGIGAGAAYFFMSSTPTPVATESPSNPEEEEADEDVVTDEQSAKKVDSQKEQSEISKKETPETEPSQVKFGSTIKFGPFHMNLGNPLENRYIRLAVALEFKGGEEQKKELELRKPQIQDTIISVTSRKTREFILAADGKDALRYQLSKQINQNLEKKIERVFITEIIVE